MTLAELWRYPELQHPTSRSPRRVNEANRFLAILS
jgi:hypothetical protein